VPDIVKQKSAFQDTCYSNNQCFCLEITNHADINPKFCQATLSHSNNSFDQISLNSAPSSYPNKKYLAIFVRHNPKTFNVDHAVQYFECKGSRKNILGFQDAVSLMLLSKNQFAFQDTWFSNNQ